MKIEIDDSELRAFVAEVMAFSEQRPDIDWTGPFTRQQPVFGLVAAPSSGPLKIKLVIDQHARAAFVKLRSRHEIAGSPPPPPADTDHPRH